MHFANVALRCLFAEWMPRIWQISVWMMRQLSCTSDWYLSIYFWYLCYLWVGCEVHKYVAQVDSCGNGTGQHKATWWHLDSIFWVAKVRSTLVRSLDGAAVACGGGGGGGHPKATRWPTRSLHPPAWAPGSAPIRPKTTLPCGDTSSIEFYKPNLTRLPFMKFPKYQREHAVKTHFYSHFVESQIGFSMYF